MKHAQPRHATPHQASIDSAPIQSAPTKSASISPSPPSTTALAIDRRSAARMLGISERLLWTWTNAGHIPHVRIGARVLYPVDALRIWLEQRTQCETPPTPRTNNSTTTTGA